MVKITYELAEEVNAKLADYIGVGVGTNVKQALRRALQGTGYDLDGTSVIEGRSKAETVEGERINYSWESFGGGSGAGTAGIVAVVNSVGDEYVAKTELYDVIDEAEFVANTLSEDGN